MWVNRSCYLFRAMRDYPICIERGVLCYVWTGQPSIDILHCGWDQTNGALRCPARGRFLNDMLEPLVTSLAFLGQFLSQVFLISEFVPTLVFLFSNALI